MNTSNTSLELSRQPRDIRHQEFTQIELQTKLTVFKGILSSIVPTSPHSSHQANTLLANTVEAMVLGKIRNNLVAQKIFINYYNNNKLWIEKGSYAHTSLHRESLTRLMSDIHCAVID